jgi:hypothetical protein
VEVKAVVVEHEAVAVVAHGAPPAARSSTATASNRKLWWSPTGLQWPGLSRGTKWRLPPGRLQPNDLLANVLWRLPPRDLAAARCVSSGWRAVVDSYWLLHPYVLPMVLAGIFVHYIDYCADSTSSSAPALGQRRRSFLHLHRRVSLRRRGLSARLVKIVFPVRV